MRRSLLAIALVVCLFPAAELCSAVELPFKDLPNVDLTFDLGSGPVEWTLKEKGDKEARFLAQEHVLTVRLTERGPQKLLSFTLELPKGGKLSVRSYAAKVTVPQAGLHAVMAPNTRLIAHTLIYFHEKKKWPENMRIYRCLIPQGFEEHANSNH